MDSALCPQYEYTTSYTIVNRFWGVLGHRGKYFLRGLWALWGALWGRRGTALPQGWLPVPAVVIAGGGREGRRGGREELGDHSVCLEGGLALAASGDQSVVRGIARHTIAAHIAQ